MPLRRRRGASTTATCATRAQARRARSPTPEAESSGSSHHMPLPPPPAAAPPPPPEAVPEVVPEAEVGVAAQGAMPPPPQPEAARAPDVVPPEGAGEAAGAEDAGEIPPPPPRRAESAHPPNDLHGGAARATSFMTGPVSSRVRRTCEAIAAAQALLQHAPDANEHPECYQNWANHVAELLTFAQMNARARAASHAPYVGGPEGMGAVRRAQTDPFPGPFPRD